MSAHFYGSLQSDDLRQALSWLTMLMDAQRKGAENLVGCVVFPSSLELTTFPNATTMRRAFVPYRGGGNGAFLLSSAHVACIQPILQQRRSVVGLRVRNGTTLRLTNHEITLTTTLITVDDPNQPLLRPTPVEAPYKVWVDADEWRALCRQALKTSKTARVCAPNLDVEAPIPAKELLSVLPSKGKVSVLVEPSRWVLVSTRYKQLAVAIDSA